MWSTIGFWTFFVAFVHFGLWALWDKLSPATSILRPADALFWIFWVPVGYFLLRRVVVCRKRILPLLIGIFFYVFVCIFALFMYGLWTAAFLWLSVTIFLRGLTTAYAQDVRILKALRRFFGPG